MTLEWETPSPISSLRTAQETLLESVYKWYATHPPDFLPRISCDDKDGLHATLPLIPARIFPKDTAWWDEVIWGQIRANQALSSPNRTGSCLRFRGFDLWPCLDLCFHVLAWDQGSVSQQSEGASSLTSDGTYDNSSFWANSIPFSRTFLLIVTPLDFDVLHVIIFLASFSLVTRSRDSDADKSLNLNVPN